MADVLIKNGANVNQAVGLFKWTPLHSTTLQNGNETNCMIYKTDF